MSRREIALRPESEVMSENREEEEIEKTNSLSVIFFFPDESEREREGVSRERETRHQIFLDDRREGRKKKLSLPSSLRTRAMTRPLLFSVCSVAL